MATKAQIQANIDSLIDDGGLSTAEELRDALKNGSNSLLESLYPDVIQDSHLTSNLFTKSSELPLDATYYINIAKQGRIVHLTGQIGIPTITGSPIGITIADVLTPAEYRMKEDLSGRRLVAAYIRDVGNSSSPTVFLGEDSSNNMTLSVQFPVSGNFFFFTLTYLTQD